MRHFAIILIMLTVKSFTFCQRNLQKEVLNNSIFNIEWAARIDLDNSVICADNVQLYIDQYVQGGDKDSPPSVLSFDTATGENIWNFVHQGNVKGAIDFTLLEGNILYAMCKDGVIAIDLEDKNLLWELDFKIKGFFRRSRLTLHNDKLYCSASWAFRTDSKVEHLLQIDTKTGEFRSIYAQKNKGNNTYNFSPPSFFVNQFSGNTLILFNEYPDAQLPFDEGSQNLMCLNLDTFEEVWKVEDFSENHPTNKFHSPILFENTIITGADKSLYCFNVYDGTFNWKTSFDYSYGIWSKTNHLLHKDRLIVNNSQSSVTCLDPRNGTIIWNNEKGGANCTDNMLINNDKLIFTSWGFGSVMVLDFYTGETIHQEHRFDNSQFTTDIVYDNKNDLYITSTYKHVVAFRLE